MSFSNNGITWSPAEPFVQTRAWQLDAPFGAGTYTVRARFADALGNWSDPWLSDQVLYEPSPLDTDPPAFSRFLPPEDATGVALDSWLACLVNDAQSGVNTDSLRLWLDGIELNLKRQPFFGGGHYITAPRDEPLDPLRTYTVRIRAVDRAVPPNAGEHEWSFTTGEGRSGDAPAQAPADLAWIGEAVPSGAGASLRFSLPARGPVWLEIFDIRGREVRKLVDGESLAAGEHALAWDGRDRRGAKLGSGIYFTRLRCGAGVLTGRITLLR